MKFTASLSCLQLILGLAAIEAAGAVA